MINTILVGDVREKLREIPDEHVNCVVTSPPLDGSVIERLGLEVERFTRSKDARVHDSPSWAAAHSTERVILRLSERQNGQRRIALDDEIGQQRLKDSTCQSIGCLPAKERASLRRMSLFAVVVAAQRIRQQADGTFVDHPYLDALVIQRTHRMGALGLLDPNVSLAIDKPRKVSNRRLFHESIIPPNCGIREEVMLV